jgi:cytochrome P450
MSTLGQLENSVVRFSQSPLVLRSLSRVMREVAPVAKLGNAVFVFKHGDVLETLASDGDFGVSANYAQKMNRTSGAFFLGMEDGERYEKEQSFSRHGFRDGDTARVRALVADTARNLIEARRDQGRMDFVRDFAKQIPLILLRDYFGVPGPSAVALERWMSSLFWELFLNFANDDGVTKSALESAAEMRPYLQTRLAEIRAKGGEDTFLGRLVAAQQNPAYGMDDLGVVRNIGGIIIGAMSTQAKAMTLALQELLERPNQLAEAQAAARDGDDELVSGYVFEALRFNPHNPLIVRHAMRPTTVAPNTPHACRVATGTQVFAMTISASFDDKGFKRPLAFDPRRPYGSYLHFGYGLHRCFGAQLVKVVLTAAMMEVLKLERLASARPPAWGVSYNGPFPSSFPIRFQAAAVA